MIIKNIAILGAGGFAREAALHILDIDPLANLVFVDDHTDIKMIMLRHKQYYVVKDWDFKNRSDEFIVGIGSPLAKEVMVKKALNAGLKPCKTIVHPKALVQDAEIGVGGIITPGVIITTSVIIGDYVILNLNTTVGHDTTIGNYVTCNPMCAISGNVEIGNGSFIGVGATILEKVKIGSNVTVGAQSCVLKDVDENAVAVGIPAKVIKYKEQSKEITFFSK